MARARSSPVRVPCQAGVVVGFLQNDKLPVVIIMLIQVKHIIPVAIYNSNAMQIQVISCANISDI